MQSHTNYRFRGGGSGGSSGGHNGNRRGGGDTIQHQQASPQFHSPQSAHQPNSSHQHIKQQSIQHQQQQQSGQLHAGPGYGMGQQSSLDQQQASATADSSSYQQDHHQGGVYNVSRGGGPPHQHHHNYVGVDSYMPPHSLHGGMYSRHDGHHSHHHQHPRGPLNNNNNTGPQNHHHPFPGANVANALMAGPSSLGHQGTVMMVYGLNLEHFNCDRLFNLFCLYGNVVRIKFLKSKECCAMVQMGDVLAIDRCVSSLNKITLFGNELQMSYSKQAFLHDVIQPFTLPCGSPSFKDFMSNKNNRFKNPEAASKNRILPPSPVLHFFNAPYGITEDELTLLFKQNTDHEPVSVKIFTPKSEAAKSYSGLITFRDPTEATEALILCNHSSMSRAGAPNPYILRLCFSQPLSHTRLQQQQQQQQEQQQTFVSGQVS